MNDFYSHFKSVCTLALNSGNAAAPMSIVGLKKQSLTRQEVKRFTSACHRGFDKAQRRIVTMLDEVRANPDLHAEERKYRELLLRKLMDGIAVTMLQMRIHLMRRLLIHDTAPFVEIGTIKENLKVANSLNEESRMTFALVADLTTFVHITDILRVDLRSHPLKLSMTDVKTGKVNGLLLDRLESYEPDRKDLERLRHDVQIRPGHLKQAERMLRQRIRVGQIEQIMKTDIGEDYESGLPIRWSLQESAIPSYAQFLNGLCSTAVETGVSGGTVARCLHLGVGNSGDTDHAKGNALSGVKAAYHNNYRSPPVGMEEVLRELISIKTPGDQPIVGDIFLSNLNALAVLPFLIWDLSQKHIELLYQRRLVIYMMFDAPGFIWMSRNVAGIDIAFHSKRETSELIQKFGVQNIVTVRGRSLKMSIRGQWTTVGGGILSRFVNDLSNPIAFMKSYKSAHFASEGSIA